MDPKDPRLQPFTRGLLDTLAPPRHAALAVEVSRPAQPPGSLHAPQTEATETHMIGTMQDLRVDAVEKQRELEEQLAAVQARRDAALARLTDEVIPQREARLARQRAALTAALGSLDAELAGAIAGALKAKRLLFLTDVPGVLDKDKQLINELSVSQIRALIADGTITGGMIPKVETCIYAIEQGVEGVVILDGKTPHAVLIELLTDGGAGTLITP